MAGSSVLSDRLLEAVSQGSFDQIRDLVRDALADEVEAAAAAAGLGQPEVYVYVADIGPDWVVYEQGNDRFRRGYSISGDTVTLGASQEVTRLVQWVPVDDKAEPVTEAVRVPGRVKESLPAAGDGGRIFGVQIIATGDSINGNRYTAAVLEAAAPLYEGAKAFDHHRSPAELASSTIQGLVGTYRNVTFTGTGLDAELHLLPSATHVAESLDASLAAQAKGLPPLVGISHDAMGSWRLVTDGTRTLREAVAIQKVNSADVVADPSAGGLPTRMVAGGIDPLTTDPIHPPHQPKKENGMKLEELLALIAAGTATPEQRAEAARLLAEPVTDPAAPPAATAPAPAAPTVAPPAAPETAPAGDLVTAGAVTEAVITRTGPTATILVTAALEQAQLPASLREGVLTSLPETFRESDLVGIVAGIKAAQAQLERAGLVPSAPAQVTTEEQARKVEALDAMFAGDTAKGYRSFKEAWVDITGATPGFLDREDTNRRILRESILGSLDARALESATTATWPKILGDAITRRMQAVYAHPSLQTWRQIVSGIVPVNDFRTQRIAKFGGYGVLPAVTQGSAYAALTTPSDEESTYAITKRGGTEDLTLETIANDDLRLVVSIPQKLGLAAAQTLYRFVFDMLASNITYTADGLALFVAGHNNTTATAPLSNANVTALRAKMRGQAAFGDASDILGIVPKYLVVPTALEELAWQICTSAVAIPATSPGPTDVPNLHSSMEPIVVDYFSDANDWFMVADPSMCPTIELGFYQGKQDPELFTQEDPTVGSHFNADKITYKIRHIYSGTPLDFRGFQRATN